MNATTPETKLKDCKILQRGGSSMVEQLVQQEDIGSIPSPPLQLRVIPLTLKQANELVAKLHRHHKPSVGHRFSLGVVDENGILHGAAIVGRPVSRELPQYVVADVNRLVTDGTSNACSVLYGACARVAKEMGFLKIQTYILESESGTSLKASGWIFEDWTSGGNWNHSWRKGRREDQPMVRKQRWGKFFRLDAEKLIEEAKKK